MDRQRLPLERSGPPQVVALPMQDAKGSQWLHLRRVLDPLRDDHGAGARREIDHRAQHGAVAAVGRAALDERQVDLEDVEPDIGKQTESRVAGADVIGGEPDPEATACIEPSAHAFDVDELLLLGDLDHQPVATGSHGVPGWPGWRRR